MRNICYLAMALLTSTTLAIAQPWDHDANIQQAVDQFLETYRAQGIAGVEKTVSRCYDDFQKSRIPRMLETCVVIDYAGSYMDVGVARIAQKKSPKQPLTDFQHPYFFPQANQQRTLEGFASLGMVGPQTARILDDIRRNTVFHLMRKSGEKLVKPDKQ